MDPDLVAELRPIRLPPGFEAFDFAGGLAIFSIALLGGLALALLVRSISEPKPSRKRLVAAGLERARGLPAGERLLRQARILVMLETKRRREPEKAGNGQALVNDALAKLKQEISDAVYRPEPELDCDRIDRDILRIARKTKA